MQAMGLIPAAHTVLVLYGDVPLIRPTCLEKLVASAGSGALALLTVKLDQAAGYGRIVRAEDGRVAAIVEHNDATPEQLKIREANSGLMAAPAGPLRDWLLGLGSSNAQREYYLTDVVAGAVRGGKAGEALPLPRAVGGVGGHGRLPLGPVEAGPRRLPPPG